MAANYEISVNLLEEFWNQNMVNLFATPLSVWEWAVGLVVLGLIKNVLTLLIGAGAVWVLYRLNIFGVGWLMLPFRKVLRGGSMPLEDLLVSFALDFLYLGLAITFFAWMFERSREKGLGRLD